MDLKPDIDPNGGQPVDHVTGELHLQGVEFKYPLRPKAKVLKGLDLRVPANTICAIVGRSGGGKSTIVHLLMRYYDPSAGKVLLDGQDICNLNLKSLHDCVCVVRSLLCAQK